MCGFYLANTIYYPINYMATVNNKAKIMMKEYDNGDDILNNLRNKTLWDNRNFMSLNNCPQALNLEKGILFLVGTTQWNTLDNNNTDTIFEL